MSRVNLVQRLSMNDCPRKVRDISPSVPFGFRWFGACDGECAHGSRNRAGYINMTRSQ